MEIKLPVNVKRILNTLNEHGFAAYVVGGCVRDYILGIEPHDWDITTDATPQTVRDIFEPLENTQVILTGEPYGTVTIMIGAIGYECTTFRSESSYSDGRRPDHVTFGKNILQDLARRDFTCNAMAYSELTGLIDPFDGQEDMNNYILKCVGNPISRFNEDALRLLRAIRFALRFNFVLDFEMQAAMHNSRIKKILSVLSKERVHDELVKILNNLTNKKDRLLKFDPIPTVYTIIDKFFQLAFSGTIYAFEPYFDYQPENLYRYRLFLAAFLAESFPISDVIYKSEIWLREYKFSNIDIKYILNIIKLKKELDNTADIKITDVKMRELLSKFNYNELYDFFDFFKHIDLIECLERNKDYPTHLDQLAVDGFDLHNLGYLGKEVGDSLNKLLDKVIINPELNNKETLIELVKDVQ